MIINLTVGLPGDAQERLDKYVASRPEGIRRSKLKAHVQGIRLNGRPAKLATPVRDGDAIEITWEAPPLAFEPQDIPLDVLYEDTRVAVINKAQGMVTHPGAGNWTGTLVNALLYRWGRGPSPTPRPGIVHRLDKDTSGLIITAKDEAASDWLTAQFAERRVKKEYIAIVQGRPPEGQGKIATMVLRDPKNKMRFLTAPVDEPEGKFALTLYRCVACYGPFSLMRLLLKTGRTHQIRVHMKHLGCPVLGDTVYGRKSREFPKATLMLHSRLLGIRLPGDADMTVFKAPMPGRFRDIIASLHEGYEKCLLE
ncbi:MAG: RluA family pseudouridine synthase [Spirochaetaceae bacterium]|jgi:23S rRNA pseudouridine1911/1915/1917 synthase|nr:RluA family pseudouridine synthase [Spirochaetaceae bacterium]